MQDIVIGEVQTL